MDANPEEFLTIEEFSILLRVHPQTVRRAIKKGRIHALRIGIGVRSSFRIPRSEIQRIALFDLEIIVNQLIDKRMIDRDGISPE